ncbi:MAG TPA: hypothetical protein VF782_00175 [Allosphingosinicella sp.]
MSILGLIGIILGFFAIPVAFTHATRVKIVYMTMIYLLHVAASVVYYRGALLNNADTNLYYYDPYQNFQDGFGLGTQGVIFVSQYLKEMVGGTYLDYFLLFQAIGFLGITILLRVFEEIHDELRIPHAPYFYALLAIPSLHFWGSALGKDGPFLLATSLALWASMRLPSRTKALIAALLLMLFLRPQVAIVAAAALSLAVIVGKGIAIPMRIALFVVGAAGSALAVTLLQSTYAIDVTSAESIGQQFERVEMVLETEDAGNTAVRGNFAVKLLSLLFRPFFFDAKEIFGLIASVESILWIGMVLLLVMRVRDVFQLFRSVFFARYAVIYGLGMTLFLAIAYWNVGLGLRQKWTMLVPMYLVMLVAVIAVRRARKRSMAEAVPAEMVLGYPAAGPPRPAVQAPLATHRG